MVGRITSIQKFSTEDGPGIRTTVFFKGCPLSCLWCHNPEGLTNDIFAAWYPVRCIGCRECRDICPESAIQENEDGSLSIDKNRCSGCGICSTNCPGGALQMVGRDIEVWDLLSEVKKDMAFYNHSQGGVTASGGECTLQHEFLLEFLKLARAEGIHTAVDTCGHNKQEVYEKLLPYTDLFLFDIKLADREKHREYTGVYPNLIRKNARFLADNGARMWIRIPIIPGYTDDLADLKETAEFINTLATVERVDLLAYNNLCISDYKNLEMDYPLQDVPLLKKEKMDKIRETMLACGLNEVVVSGTFKERE